MDFYHQIKNLRIPNTIPHVLIIISGYLYTTGFENWFSIQTINLFISSTFILSFIFAINNVLDTEEDSASPLKENFITKGVISKESAVTFSSLIVVLGFFLAFLSFQFKVLLILPLVVLGFLYSIKPIRLKERPPLDVISHGLVGGALLFLVGTSLNTRLNWDLILISLIFFNISVMFTFWNMILDYKYDKKSGLKTSALILGKKRSKILLFFFVPINFVLAIISSLNILTSIIFLIFTLYFSLEIYRKEDPNKLTMFFFFFILFCLVFNF